MSHALWMSAAVISTRVYQWARLWLSKIKQSPPSSFGQPNERPEPFVRRWSRIFSSQNPKKIHVNIRGRVTWLWLIRWVELVETGHMTLVCHLFPYFLTSPSHGGMSNIVSRDYTHDERQTAPRTTFQSMHLPILVTYTTDYQFHLMLSRVCAHHWGCARFIDRRVVLGAVCPGHYSRD
jgi:hypothetical protein